MIETEYTIRLTPSITKKNPVNRTMWESMSPSDRQVLVDYAPRYKNIVVEALAIAPGLREAKVVSKRMTSDIRGVIDITDLVNAAVKRVTKKIEKAEPTTFPLEDEI